LDVPGAVHTIRTPSNVLFYLSLLWILLISLYLVKLELKTERQLDSKLVVIMGKIKWCRFVYI
jgi:hypothetical protein